MSERRQKGARKATPEPNNNNNSNNNNNNNNNSNQGTKSDGDTDSSAGASANGTSPNLPNDTTSQGNVWNSNVTPFSMLSTLNASTALAPAQALMQSQSSQGANLSTPLREIGFKRPASSISNTLQFGTSAPRAPQVPPPPPGPLGAGGNWRTAEMLASTSARPLQKRMKTAEDLKVEPDVESFSSSGPPPPPSLSACSRKASAAELSSDQNSDPGSSTSSPSTNLNNNTLVASSLRNNRDLGRDVTQPNGSRQRRSSRFRGVCWLKKRRAWRARIEIEGVRKHLGYFNDEEDAARAYDARARATHGLSARLNFPDQPGDANVQGLASLNRNSSEAAADNNAHTSITAATAATRTSSASSASSSSYAGSTRGMANDAAAAATATATTAARSAFARTGNNADLLTQSPHLPEHLSGAGPIASLSSDRNFGAHLYAPPNLPGNVSRAPISNLVVSEQLSTPHLSLLTQSLRGGGDAQVLQELQEHRQQLQQRQQQHSLSAGIAVPSEPPSAFLQNSTSPETQHSSHALSSSQSSSLPAIAEQWVIPLNSNEFVVRPVLNGTPIFMQFFSDRASAVQFATAFSNLLFGTPATSTLAAPLATAAPPSLNSAVAAQRYFGDSSLSRSQYPHFPVARLSSSSSSSSSSATAPAPAPPALTPTLSSAANAGDAIATSTPVLPSSGGIAPAPQPGPTPPAQLQQQQGLYDLLNQLFQLQNYQQQQQQRLENRERTPSLNSSSSISSSSSSSSSSNAHAPSTQDASGLNFLGAWAGLSPSPYARFTTSNMQQQQQQQQQQGQQEHEHRLQQERGKTHHDRN